MTDAVEAILDTPAFKALCVSLTTYVEHGHEEGHALQAAAVFGRLAATEQYPAEAVIKALHRTECYADAASGAGAGTDPSRRYGRALDVLLNELYR